MTLAPELDTRTVMRIGRKRTQHLPRVLIEDGHVVLRTRCGIDPLGDGWTETHGIATCDACIDDETAATERPKP
ncbi:hypothetical protein [Janibacter terrae]|uniref:hypothetical protein n=1 Tax=Janibacter terrae TaxID=103817 RepID=UPI0031F943F0